MYPHTFIRLHTIFSCLHSVGLKVKPSKCSLFKERISFLGHMVSAQGIDPQEGKIKSIHDWPVPKCVRDVRAFFGQSCCRTPAHNINTWTVSALTYCSNAQCSLSTKPFFTARSINFGSKVQQTLHC